ncbi:MAG: bi-domain-containing oxidoreductase [bacterium]
MKQVFLHKGAVLLHNVETPILEEKEVLVKNYYSFISTGTESATVSASKKSLIKKFAGNMPVGVHKFVGALREHGFAGVMALVKAKKQQLFSLGYSCSGRIVQVGSKVENFRIGDYVACAGAGMAHHAEYVAVPENLVVKIEDKTYLKQASLTTIGAIALQGVRRAEVQLGEYVCVIGMGLIGQLTAQLAKRAGAIVFGVDIQQDRLDLARQLGVIDYAFNVQTDDVIKEVMFATRQYGVDTTIITAASNSGSLLQQAMCVTRRKGKVVLVGDVKIDFDRDPFYAKEIDLLISCSYGPGRYDKAYEREGHDYPYSYVRWTENRNMQLFALLVQNKQIVIDPLISYEYNIADAEKAYAQLRQKKTLGIVLSYTDNQEDACVLGARKEKMTPELYKKSTYSYVKESSAYTPPKNIMRVGVIGVGGFCKIKLLPIISKLKNVRIHSIIDVDAANLFSTAQIYEARRISNDSSKVFLDDDINALVIATPHCMHAQQALDGLLRGKAVFVEKPAAVTYSQLRALKEHLAQNPDSFYCVDFNRSFAPFITDIKNIISQRTNPLIMTYRMNAGLLPTDHWIQSEQNRGRIIGEACHIFDLFCFLTESQPEEVSVQTIGPNNSGMLITDNISVQIRMRDGSSCNLIYTSLGPKNMSKEYMELFFDGKSIIMNDFTQLTGYGLPMSFNKKVSTADKGHEILIKKFFHAAQQQVRTLPPIPYERIIMATELSLIVDELARKGGGCKVIDV